MKTFILFFIAILIASTNSFSQNFWEKTAGPDTSTTNSLAINSIGHIFAATKNGIFRSTNNGDNWLNLGINDSLRVVFVATNGDVFITTQQQGSILYSSDNGNNWTPIGLSSWQTSIAVNANGDIFAGTATDGIWRTTNNGTNWTQIIQGLTNFNINTLIVKSNQHLFAGTLSQGVFRSTDNGDNWVQISQGLTNNNVTAFAIKSNGDLFAGTVGGGVFRSSDNGNNWSSFNQGLAGEGLYIRSFAINSNADILAGTAGGTFRFTNNGVIWEQLNQGLTTLNIKSLAINSKDGVFAGTDAGIFRTFITANLKVYLQGPYSGGGVMTTTLNTNNLIPLNSNTAYPALTYGYSASTVTSIPNSDIVDWVLVELRTGTASGTKVATRAGFLKSDGTIVDTNGTDPLKFAGLGNGNYYTVVRHRNHLAIMTASAIPLSSNSALYDLSTSQSQAYGTNPMKLLSVGSYGMMGGDGNTDGSVDYPIDILSLWFPNFGLTGYMNSDSNMDGLVDYPNDILLIWFPNFGLTKQVP